MTDITLVIGDKTFSSWSLRPWLVLKHIGVPFAGIPIRLRQPDSKARILEHSPSGKVPLLKHGERLVWDSLAICDYLAETFPQARLWPGDPDARALARSIAAEMHSGFVPLRTHMSMDLKTPHPGEGRTPEVAADIARIVAIWTGARTRHGAGGPFLFGEFTIADAMYAPVATRFATYGVELDGAAAAFRDTILAMPAMREWTAAALAE
jgi:glutathione S-transferase